MRISDFLKKCLFTPNGTCPVCGKVLFSDDHFLCGSCYESLPIMDTDTCERCGRPTAKEGVCKNCLRSEGAVQDGGVVWLDYVNSSRKIIAEMKFNGRQGLCHYVGMQLGEVVAQAPWVKEIRGIVPVPLHPNRLAERGYNQSALLAKGIATFLKDKAGLELPITPVLERCIDTPHQVGQGRRGRLENLNEAFQSIPDVEIKGKTFLLVDDVMTTGATLQACTTVLKDGGAKKVYTAAAAAVSSYATENF